MYKKCTKRDTPSPLDDLALLEDEDAIGIGDGGEAMGHHDCGPAAADGRQRRLDVPLRLCVQRGRRLIQQHQLRRFQQGARNGHPLLLSARELETSLANLKQI